MSCEEPRQVKFQIPLNVLPEARARHHQLHLKQATGTGHGHPKSLIRCFDARGPPKTLANLGAAAKKAKQKRKGLGCHCDAESIEFTRLKQLAAENGVITLWNAHRTQHHA